MIEYILDEKGYKLKSTAKPIKYIITKNNCWECISHIENNSGYIYVGRNNKLYGIHRYSYELYYKEKIPDNMIIMHICDNSKCINPEHLEIGTQKDNMQDMMKKGRKCYQRGKDHPNFGKSLSKETKKKLSDSKKGLKHWKTNIDIDKALSIKKDLINRDKNESFSKTEKKLAEKYNYSISLIKAIRLGKHWISPEIGGGLKEWY